MNGEAPESHAADDLARVARLQRVAASRHWSAPLGVEKKRTIQQTVFWLSFSLACLFTHFNTRIVGNYFSK